MKLFHWLFAKKQAKTKKPDVIETPPVSQNVDSNVRTEKPEPTFVPEYVYTDDIKAIPKYEWILVKEWGSNGFSGLTSLYLNPKKELAKRTWYQVTYWGYHDECDAEEEEVIISVEDAIKMLYPDQDALSFLLKHTAKDYTQFLNELKTKEELKQH